MTTQSTTTDTEVPVRKKRGLMVALLAIGVVAGIAVAMRGKGKPAEGEVIETDRDAPFLDGKLIRFSKSFAKRNAITSHTVAAAAITPKISVVGTVAFDPRKFAAVGSRVAGRVRRVFKVVGEAVKANDPLCEIESAELGRYESELLGVRARELAAQTNSARERRLADARISSEREAETADANHKAISAERTAIERTVQSLGGDAVGELGVFILRSPIAGKVVASKVARGQTVEATTTTYEIAELDTLWISLNVYERDIAAIAIGDRVEIGAHTAIPVNLEGKVAHVGDLIDQNDRTASVRVEIDNRDGQLRPGQSVTASIHTRVERANILTVPRVAVTRIDGNPVALVLVSEGAVEARELVLGAEDAENVAVLEGLKAGERVVVEGLFALRSEIFR